ncbi:MAG: cell division protein ZapA [Azospirillaceae bacterium]
MARVDISLNGRSYPIACDDGQENRVRSIAEFLDQRMRELSRAAPSATEAQLLVMTALMVTDELFDLQEAQENAAAVPNGAEADALARLVGRVEALAGRIEQA